MTRIFTLLASSAILSLGAVAAHADCAADLAAYEAGAQEGIAKDGSLAPLQTDADAGAATGQDAQEGFEAAAADGAAGAPVETGMETAEGDAEADAVAKDGALAPLEAAEGASAGVAISAQDAQAQQSGAPTATEQASSDVGAGAGGEARDAALERAHAALAAGDEAGCAAALREAQAS